MTKDITSEDFAPDLLLALLAVREAAWFGVFNMPEVLTEPLATRVKIVSRTLWAACDMATATLADYGLVPE